jgi:hypothetical protein
MRRSPIFSLRISSPCFVASAPPALRGPCCVLLPSHRGHNVLQRRAALAPEHRNRLTDFAAVAAVLAFFATAAAAGTFGVATIILRTSHFSSRCSGDNPSKARASKRRSFLSDEGVVTVAGTASSFAAAGAISVCRKAGRVPRLPRKSQSRALRKTEKTEPLKSPPMKCVR